METELDKLIHSIRPEKTIEEVFNRANEAIDTFHPETAQISKWEDFRDCMAEFLRHVEACALRLNKPVNTSSDFYWARCAHVLLKVYGSSGEKAAFEMARTGNQGGLNAVLRAVAMHMAEQYAQNEISGKVGIYWQRLSVEEQLDASSEYIDKYGRFLPSELTEGSAARIRANFPKVLEKHPRLIQKIRLAAR
jgi:hypothetical protein